MHTKTVTSAALLAALLLLPASARADDPRKAQSEKPYQEGLILHGKKQEKEALEKFKEAYAIYPTPNTLVSIARAEEITDQPLAAMRHYREALKNPMLHPRNATRARDNIALLQKRLGRIDVKGPEGTTFTVDGQRYTTPLAAPIDVLPGTVSLSAKLGEVTYEGQGIAVAGNEITIDLVSTAPTATTEPVVTTPTVVPPWRYDDTTKDKVYKRQTNTTRYIVSGTMIGLGVVGLGMGVGFTAAANSASSNRTKAAEAVGGSNTACTGGGSNCGSLNDYAKNKTRDSNIAVGSYIAGGVLVVGGVAAYFMMPKTQKRYAAVVPWVGKDGAGLAYGKEF